MRDLAVARPACTVTRAFFALRAHDCPLDAAGFPTLRLAKVGLSLSLLLRYCGVWKRPKTVRATARHKASQPWSISGRCSEEPQLLLLANSLLLWAFVWSELISSAILNVARDNLPCGGIGMSTTRTIQDLHGGHCGQESSEGPGMLRRQGGGRTNASQAP